MHFQIKSCNFASVYLSGKTYDSKAIDYSVQFVQSLSPNISFTLADLEDVFCQRNV